MGSCTSSSIKETSPSTKADSPEAVPAPTPTVPTSSTSSIPAGSVETTSISEVANSDKNANEQPPVGVESITLESSNTQSDEKSEDKIEDSEGVFS